MDHWTEIRTASHVARLGTVTAAATALGVHRATINRHIDALEKALGGKLFQRHSKGFTTTDLGEELLRIANTADEQFEELNRKAKGQAADLTGEFIVTSIPVFAPTLLPALKSFGEKHPDLTIRFLADDSLLRLEYGEAHVAFRAGQKPDNPDNVVREFERIELGLFAHQSYVDRFGMPNGQTEFSNHRFVGSDTPNTGAVFQRWLHASVPAENITFRSNSQTTLAQAVLAGNGIGFLPRAVGNQNTKLLEVIQPMEEWVSQMWLVTHVDLHRTQKVQAFLKELPGLEKTASWL